MFVFVSIFGIGNVGLKVGWFKSGLIWGWFFVRQMCVVSFLLFFLLVRFVGFLYVWGFSGLLEVMWVLFMW